MEVCTIVEGQRYLKLNEKQATAILTASCQRPHEMQENIKKMANYQSDDQFAKEFGMKVDDRLAVIEGARVLQPPMLKYHESGKERIKPQMGQWNMMNSKMVNGATINHWAFVNVSSLSRVRVLKFINDLVAICRSRGMNMNPEPLFPFLPASHNKIEKALTDYYNKAAKLLGDPGKLQLLIVILPDVSGTYGKIKRICETELGIVSQCCQPITILKNNSQYLENLSMKINVKAGGRNILWYSDLNDPIHAGPYQPVWESQEDGGGYDFGFFKKLEHGCHDLKVSRTMPRQYTSED